MSQLDPVALAKILKVPPVELRQAYRIVGENRSALLEKSNERFKA